jgi:hypothetical protein
MNENESGDDEEINALDKYHSVISTPWISKEVVNLKRWFVFLLCFVILFTGGG